MSRGEKSAENLPFLTEFIRSRIFNSRGFANRVKLEVLARFPKNSLRGRDSTYTRLCGPVRSGPRKRTGIGSSTRIGDHRSRTARRGPEVLIGGFRAAV